MSSISISSPPAEVPESVCKVVEAFVQGDLSLLEVRQAVTTALEENPAVAEPIHELLDEALKNRALTIAEYGELVSAVGAVASENVPTEMSEDAPDEPGVFRVVDEGTLVPADMSEWPEFQAHAADDADEEGQHTQPYGLEAVKNENAGSEAVNEEVIDETDGGVTTVVETGSGTVLRDRFRLEEEVARGAMGVVYRATDLMKLDVGAADPQVAIKLVSPDIAGDSQALRSFQNEFVSTQHLSHPSIIRVFELDRDGEQYFITMEWLEGQSLASLLDNSQSSALQPTQTYAIIEQLCDALEYAHERNVVHADIKPGNVFLLESGEVKLIDFGIARCASDLADQTGDVSGEAVALTPAYASCERLEQQTPTPQDDLYSLASLIYRLLAGRRVFGPLTALEAESQEAEVVRIGSMSGRRWNALFKALSFRAAGRQASVSEFVEDFGRRSQPRDEVAEEPEQRAIDDTAQMPILDSVVDTAADLDLPDDMEVDFPLDEAPEPAPQPIDYPPKTDRKKDRPVAGPLAEKLPAVSPEPLLERLSNVSTVQIQAAGGVLAAIVLLAVLVNWLGGDEQAEPARTVTMPELAAPIPVAEPAPIVEPELAVEPEPVVAVVVEPEPIIEEMAAPEPVIEPEPAVAEVAKPEPALEPELVVEPEATAEEQPLAEPEPVVEPEATAEEQPLAEPELVVEPEATAEEQPLAETEAKVAAAAEPEATEAGATDVAPAEAEQPELMFAANVDDLTAVPAEAELVGPMPVYVPPLPESVELSELKFIKYVEPSYPRGTRDRRDEGWVDLEFRVGSDGLPVDIEVVDSNLPAKFEGASVSAVEKWRFEPYIHEGEAIAVDSAVRLRYAN